MMKKLISILIVVVCLPSLVYAQTHRCQSPDGSISFQSKPCQKGEDSAEVNMKLVNSAEDNVRQPIGNPSSTYVRRSSGKPSSAQQTSGTSQYPYARKGDIEELKATNDELQKAVARMKKEDPDWERIEWKKRVSDRAKVIDANTPK